MLGFTSFSPTYTLQPRRQDRTRRNRKV